MTRKKRQLFWILIIEFALLCMVDRHWPPVPRPLAATINSFTSLPSTIHVLGSRCGRRRALGYDRQFRLAGMDADE